MYSLRDSRPDNAKSEQDTSCEEHESEENEAADKWRLKMNNNFDDVKCDQQSEGEHEFEWLVYGSNHSTQQRV